MRNALLPCALAFACVPVHAADWSLLSRNYFLDNDYRSPGPNGQSLRREWAQGFIGKFSSDVTPGTIGLGVDAHAFLGLKLDGGRGHAGTGLLPLDSDGRSENHLLPGDGVLPLREQLQALRRAGYDGAATIELVSMYTDDPTYYAKCAIERVRELL